MAGDLMRYGFDEGCFTPGNLSDRDNPYTDFKLVYKKKDGERLTVNGDTGEVVDTYLQHGWYWYPHVRLMNDPAAPGTLSWWPNSPESENAFGLHMSGPDVELEFAFNFMERQQKQTKPFFIYHTTHLGHAGYDLAYPGEWSMLASHARPELGWPGLPAHGPQHHRRQRKLRYPRYRPLPSWPARLSLRTTQLTAREFSALAHRRAAQLSQLGLRLQEPDAANPWRPRHERRSQPLVGRLRISRGSDQFPADQGLGGSLRAASQSARASTQGVTAI